MPCIPQVTATCLPGYASLPRFLGTALPKLLNPALPSHVPLPRQQGYLPKQKWHLWSHSPPPDHEDTASSTILSLPINNWKDIASLQTQWERYHYSVLHFPLQYTPPSSPTRRLHGVARSAMLSNSSLEARPVPALLHCCGQDKATLSTCCLLYHAAPSCSYEVPTRTQILLFTNWPH